MHDVPQIANHAQGLPPQLRDLSTTGGNAGRFSEGDVRDLHAFIQKIRLVGPQAHLRGLEAWGAQPTHCTPKPSGWGHAEVWTVQQPQELIVEALVGSGAI